MSGDWDALAHVRILREGGGPSSGYTADLIERMWRQRASARIAIRATLSALSGEDVTVEEAKVLLEKSAEFIEADYNK